MYFCLDPPVVGQVQKYQKIKAVNSRDSSLQLRRTNPRPRLDNYQLIARSNPAWLRIRNALLHFTNREFKARQA